MKKARARTQKLIYDGLQSCPYLPGQVARLPLYRQLRDLRGEAADLRFESGERRVGRSLYRTECPTCRACEPIRVPVHDLRPSRSQRRVAARWPADLRIEVGPPTCTDEKLALFNRHREQRGLVEEDEWPMEDIGYESWLVLSCFETVEMAYYLGDRLVAVGVLDLGLRGASSVYFYFDPAPEISRLSPGVFSVLQEAAFCRDTGRDHLYLGLYARDCRSLSYKAQYHPHERLVDGAWRRFDQGDG